MPAEYCRHTPTSRKRKAEAGGTEAGVSQAGRIGKKYKKIRRVINTNTEASQLEGKKNLCTNLAQGPFGESPSNVKFNNKLSGT